MHSSIAGDDKMNSESRDASEEVSVFRPSDVCKGAQALRKTMLVIPLAG